VIQAAVDRALKAGMNTDLAFLITKQLNKKVPVVYLTYYNIILQRGVETFAEDCRDSGVAGLIVADLPFEESGRLRAACRASGVDYIHIVTPNTPPARMQMILEDASGFVYLVSNMGVTGARRDLAKGLGEVVARTIECSNGTPVAVGFGISGPEQVRDVLRMGADGAIVGSAIVGLAATGATIEDVLKFVEGLKAGTGGKVKTAIKIKK
jgi:tryptophan synthase alpha chain